MTSILVIGAAVRCPASEQKGIYIEKEVLP